MIMVVKSKISRSFILFDKAHAQLYGFLTICNTFLIISHSYILPPFILATGSLVDREPHRRCWLDKLII